MKPYNIIFVCTGNACRSPFAETIMKKLLLKSNLQIQVCSAGTLDWGSNQRDKEMIEVAKEMGYTLSGVTQAISYDMLKQMNLIIVFESVQKDLVTKYVEYGHWDRIVLFNDIAFNKIENLQDPHFQSHDIYKKVAKTIEEGCKILIDKWKMNPPYTDADV